MPLLYRIGQVLTFPFIYLLFRPRAIGRENLPKSGPLLLAPNHASYLDPPVLSSKFIRVLHYLAKAELFKNAFLRFIFTSGGQVRVDRGKGNDRALEEVVKLLKKGKSVAVFPEGTTGHSCKLKRGHTGIARIALEARVPIIPVGLINVTKALPPGARMIRPRSVKVIFGKPLDVSKWYGMQNNREITRKVTLMVMRELAILTGEKDSLYLNHKDPLSQTLPDDGRNPSFRDRSSKK